MVGSWAGSGAGSGANGLVGSWAGSGAGSWENGLSGSGAGSWVGSGGGDSNEGLFSWESLSFSSTNGEGTSPSILIDLEDKIHIATNFEVGVRFGFESVIWGAIANIFFIS